VVDRYLEPLRNIFCATSVSVQIIRQNVVKTPIPISASASLTSVGLCASSPCLNGGTCESHDGTFTCFCAYDHAGERCERELSSAAAKGDVQVAAFDGSGSAFVELVPLAKAEHKLSVEIEFRSHTANGMLLYAQEYKDGSGDFVAIVIVDG
jgi:hypothetical protein